MNKIFALLVSILIAVPLRARHFQFQRISSHTAAGYSCKAETQGLHHGQVRGPKYIETGYRISEFARKLSPRLLVYTDVPGAILVRSVGLKKAGFCNADIRTAETGSGSTAFYKLILANKSKAIRKNNIVFQSVSGGLGGRTDFFNE